MEGVGARILDGEVRKQVPCGPMRGPIEVPSGSAWLVDAYGCDPERLRSTAGLEALFGGIVADLGLHPIGPPRWHVFPSPGGVTGFLLLSESHLSVHTFPERGFAALDLYCCRPRPPWDFTKELEARLGAARVTVQHVARGEGGAP